MNINFYQQYKNYTNVDLLKVVKRPDAYQPEAVAAASELLTQRDVSDEEIQLVEEYYTAIDDKQKVRKEKVDAYKSKAVDFLEPVLQPSENVEPKKWLNIFLLVVAVQYAWVFFNTVKRFISYLNCDYCTFDFLFFFEFVSLVYIPVILLLLYKRRRWGWILLFADNLFILLSTLSQSYLFFKYRAIHGGDTASFLFTIFIRTVFVFFLWRDVIANHFNVNGETKRKTVIIASVITVIFILAISLLV